MRNVECNLLDVAMPVVCVPLIDLSTIDTSVIEH